MFPLVARMWQFCIWQVIIRIQFFNTWKRIWAVYTHVFVTCLASLITFSEFRVLYPGHSKQYFWMFTAINVGFLVIMTIAAKLFFL